MASHLEIVEPACWEDPDIWQRIIANVPPYRLSKFQPASPCFQQGIPGQYLLDLDGTWSILLGDTARKLEGVVDILRDALPGGVARLGLEPERLPAVAKPQSDIRYIDTQDALVALCQELLKQDCVGLAVETTLFDHELCTVQFSTPTYNAVIDARTVHDLGLVAEVLASRDVVKIIRNANFELSVFTKLSIVIKNISIPCQHPDDSVAGSSAAGTVLVSCASGSWVSPSTKPSRRRNGPAGHYEKDSWPMQLSMWRCCWRCMIVSLVRC